MILVEGIRCDVFQCLSYRWKRRKDIERMAKKNTYDAGSIAILEGLEAVRKRPGMYIGSVSTKGLNHLIYEIVDNAVDEHLAGYCSEIHVTLEKDGSATIADNGRGVPVDLHATGVSAARVVYDTSCGRKIRRFGIQDQRRFAWCRFFCCKCAVYLYGCADQQGRIYPP